MATSAPLPSHLTPGPAGCVARLCATAQQCAREREELACVEDLLSTLLGGTDDLITASVTPADAVTEVDLMLTSPAAHGATTVREDWGGCDAVVAWCASPDANAVLHSSGLSTSFAALERQVSDAAVRVVGPRLRRTTRQVTRLCAFVNKRARRTDCAQALPRESAQWTSEAMRVIHELAHAPLENHSGVPRCPGEAQSGGDAEYLPAYGGIWPDVYASLSGVLRAAAPCITPAQQEKSEEAAETRVEQQRRRLLVLLGDMTSWLVDGVASTHPCDGGSRAAVPDVQRRHTAPHP
ncbi:hypothetical protein NESM_000316700 [Novymonas esmeraldas]|uniref:Uncharacterized protein n=1 Tax=Novymonas esmeraldas TaxID=1808958 RepID=A0AAW0EMF8_9TRYP